MIPEALVHIQKPFSFAVISDTHFVTKDAVDQALGEGRPLEAEQYAENVTYALAPMMDALRRLAPDFLVITGDLAEPSLNPGDHKKNLEAALHFFATCDIPMLVVRGNLDGTTVYDEVVLPHNQEWAGDDAQGPYFFFEIDGAYFIVLDTSYWDKTQCEWLEGVLKQCAQEKDKRVFVFGHHPIWSLARAYFSNREFQADVQALVSQYDIDAYFCGHSHNQNIMSHRTAGLPVLQCSGALIGLSDEPPLPLDQVQALLPVPDDLVGVWPGYLENTAPGWFMGYVGHRLAGVEWHHLNRGAEANFRWRSPGDFHTFWTMAPVPAAQMVEADLLRVRRAFLRFCAWDGQKGVRVFLNGELIGTLPVLDGFAAGRLDIPPALLGLLQMENKLRIEPCDDCDMTIGNLVLEVVLPGGRHVRTQIFEDIYTWSARWDKEGLGRLQKMKPQIPLTTVLAFR